MRHCLWVESLNEMTASGSLGKRAFTRMAEFAPLGAAEQATDAPRTLIARAVLIACWSCDAKPATVCEMGAPLPMTLITSCWG